MSMCVCVWGGLGSVGGRSVTPYKSIHGPSNVSIHTRLRSHARRHALTPLDGRDARLAGVLLLLELPDGVADVVLFFWEGIVW